MITIVQTPEQLKNMAVARQINRETWADSNSAYAGRFVGVLHQQVVATADTLEELGVQLDTLGDDSREAIWIEASADYDRTYFIGGTP